MTRVKISKVFEQKLALFGIKTPFKVQMGCQKLSKAMIESNATDIFKKMS